MKIKERECLTMGCDIHGGLEIKDLDGKWHPASSIVQDLTDFDKGYASDLPLGRNYTLFSILEADHPRNYSKVKSIAPARGLPKDTTYADELDDIDFWGQSYVTLQEIVDFADEHSIVKKQGYVLKEDYEALQAGEITEPSLSWQGGSSDMMKYHATWNTISPIVDLCGYLKYLARIFEQRCLDQLCGDNDSKLAEKCQKWMHNTGENIRLVFAFDN